MSAEIEFAIYCVAAPAAVAIMAAWLLRVALAANIRERFSLPAAWAAGFFVGYALLPDGASLLPQRHWQWLPWLGLAAGLVGRSSAPSYLSLIAWAILAAVSAWLLVPTWTTLWPPRLVTFPLLAAYLFLLMSLFGVLPNRLITRALIGYMAVSAIAVALCIAIGVSATYGRITALAAAALIGCYIAAMTPAWRPMQPDASPDSLGIRSLIPAFAVLVGGIAFVGTIEPKQPLPIIMLAPAAPLTLWLFAAGPLAKLQGWKAGAVQVVAVLLPLIIALAAIILA